MWLLFTFFESSKTPVNEDIRSHMTGVPSLDRCKRDTSVAAHMLFKNRRSPLENYGTDHQLPEIPNIYGLYEGNIDRQR
jgi:hypothetical protein